jgi:hypothetical protein
MFLHKSLSMSEDMEKFTKDYASENNEEEKEQNNKIGIF